jgi:CcmD family protein
MDGTTPMHLAVEIAFAGANVLVWSGLFLYLLRLTRRLRHLEERRSGPAQPAPRGNDGATGGLSTPGPRRRPPGS